MRYKDVGKKMKTVMEYVIEKNRSNLYAKNVFAFLSVFSFND